jgi:hypothetical protein
MKARRLHQPGGPDAFVLEEIARPKPAAGEVLIEVRAFGLNRSEWFTRIGESPTVKLPRVLGIECVGTVVTDPSGELATGQRVAAMMGGMGRLFDGSYAEYTSVPSSSVFPLETALPWELLGALPEMLQTCHDSLHTGLQVQILLLLALAITAFMQPGQRVYAFLDSLYLGDVVLTLLPFVPYALLWVSFTLLYTGLPNTHVRRRSAIVGAVIAGTLWQLAQWAYVTFVIRMVRYSAVYGALWQIPILLAWIYIAWSIIVYGCQVSRAHQEIVATRRAARSLAR